MAIRQVEGYPSFSADEFRRRYAAVQAMAQRKELDALVVYGAAAAAGYDVQYLANVPVTRESVLIVATDEATPEQATLLVQLYNHVPFARRASIIPDVRWGGPDLAAAVAEQLVARKAAAGRVGVVGPMPFAIMDALRSRLPRAHFVDVTADFRRLRLVKSEEELAWVRMAARLTDESLWALARELRPGLKEYELPAIIEAPYLRQGAQNRIHYVLTTSMSRPAVCVPSQYPSNREIAAGDVLVIENSVSYWGYDAQLLRTFTVAAAPTPLYQRLHDVAVAAYQRIFAVLRPGATAADVVAAADLILEEGFTTYDDLLHGYVGGYLEPILQTRDRLHRPVPEFVFQENMTVVIQPNVITRDETAGVQVGQLVRITHDGAESLHQFPMELLRCG